MWTKIPGKNIIDSTGYWTAWPQNSKYGAQVCDNKHVKTYINRQSVLWHIVVTNVYLNSIVHSAYGAPALAN